eukprot:TRINITY_DN18202_c0_g1_i1.p1 TRINITY_DN18202_c0_g1~~TRINITY_DN18202_c0_g1_i1.p1  ORF type:complete len:103 (+),score=24.02 TRINITY_DN18202_c0_g1_i1:179-487(+)
MEFIEKEIASQPVVLFTKSYCPFCAKTKKLFDYLKVKYKAIDIDTMKDRLKIEEALQTKTGAHTVPRVFIKGICIGGCDDTQEEYQSGELNKKLAAAGVPVN